MGVDEPACMIAAMEPGVDRAQIVRMVAVAEQAAVIGLGVSAVQQGRIPVIAAEYLVGALARLDHFQMFRDLLRKQIETDYIMADHRFGHGFDGRWKG